MLYRCCSPPKRLAPGEIESVTERGILHRQALTVYDHDAGAGEEGVELCRRGYGHCPVACIGHGGYVCAGMKMSKFVRAREATGARLIACTVVWCTRVGGGSGGVVGERGPSARVWNRK